MTPWTEGARWDQVWRGAMRSGLKGRDDAKFYDLSTLLNIRCSLLLVLLWENWLIIINFWTFGMIGNYKYALKWSYIVWCGYQKIFSHGIQARKQLDICEIKQVLCHDWLWSKINSLMHNVRKWSDRL